MNRAFGFMNSIRVLLAIFTVSTAFVACGLDDGSALDCFGGSSSKSNKSNKSSNKTGETDGGKQTPLCEVEIDGQMKNFYDADECNKYVDQQFTGNTGGNGLSTDRNDPSSKDPFNQSNKSPNLDRGEFR